MLGLCFPRTNKRDLPLARYRLPVNRHFASFQPDPPRPSSVESLTFDALLTPPPPLFANVRSSCQVSSAVSSGKRATEKGFQFSHISPLPLPLPLPALFPRTNENSWPYSMINAATVCRFMHKCADTCVCVCVCVADFDEFESKEGKIHTYTHTHVCTYVANDRG